jgi:hypothetical protein
LQYCGHSITRSMNCSRAAVPNINICNKSTKQHFRFYVKVGDNDTSHRFM